MEVNLWPAGVTPASLIEEYLRLRDSKKSYEERIKEALHKKFTERMDTIEALLLDTLNGLGADSLKTDQGTCFKRVETSVTVSSPAEFQRHVIGTQQWELIDFRANKTAVKAFVQANDGALPPGVNYTPSIVLSIRRPSQ